MSRFDFHRQPLRLIPFRNLTWMIFENSTKLFSGNGNFFLIPYLPCNGQHVVLVELDWTAPPFLLMNVSPFDTGIQGSVNEQLSNQKVP